MRVILTGVAVLSATVVSPAAAAEVPVDQARRTVEQACQQTLTALSDGGVVTGLTEVTVAVGRFHVSLPGSDRTVDAATGTYGPISETALTPKQRKTARGYAGSTSATHWLNAGRFAAHSSWDATFTQSLGEAVGLATCVGGLDAGPVRRNGTTWSFERYAAVFELDDQGRLVKMARDGEVRQYMFGPQDVQIPGTTIGYRVWRKASEAASLNATLRALTRQVATEVNGGQPSVDLIGEVLAASIPADRVVPLKTRTLRRGYLVHARNPYTKGYFAWRVYLDGKQAVARKVAPLT